MIYSVGVAMPKTRPTSILVVAIFHFIFGGLGLTCGLCGVIGQAAGGNKMFAGGGAGGQNKMQEEMEVFMQQKNPHFKAAQYASIGANLVLSLFMVISGLGLLQMASWGRILSIIYGVLSIGHSLLGFLDYILFQMPVMKEFIAQYRPAPGQAGEAEKVALKVMDVILTFTAVMPLVFMIYPIIVLVIMLRPKIAAAFRGEKIAREPDDYRDQPDEPEDRWER